MTATRRAYPTFIPGLTAIRHLPAGFGLAASQVGAIVHAVRDGQHIDGTASVCGRRSPTWRVAAGAPLAESRLCVSCARRMGLWADRMHITVAEVVPVHARVLRRAVRHPDPARGLGIRLAVRLAAIGDGSIFSGMDIVGVRAEGVWPSDAWSAMPTATEAGWRDRLTHRSDDRRRPEIVSGMDRVRGRYGAAYRSAR